MDVLPVQLPGRFTRLREAVYTDLKPLVLRIADELADEFTQPFSLFGHSMGALIAFELSRELVKRGQRPPLRLFVSARRAPQLPDLRPPMHHLPEPEFIQAVTRLQGTPREVLEHPELMALALPLLRAEFQLCETYQYVPAPPLAVPITAFAGLRDDDCPPSVVAAWSAQTDAEFQAHTCDGDHFFVQQLDEFVFSTVFEVSRRDLNGARGGLPNAQRGPALGGGGVR
jgi:medium-chain acyl-[acyl-carrier-protein] hydrolase